MPRKILLADDSLTIQKVVELTFSDSDLDLVCVGNGLRALEKVKEDRPDLVLADVVMPEKNGYEVCEAIKGDPSTARIPVILLTGTFEPFDRARAERIGADAIVSKPFDSQQLLGQVEALLSRATAEPSAATVAIRIPEDLSGAAAPARREGGPFEAGFSSEDFTGSIRVRPGAGDPFEEEYGRGDVDSAIEAFEKAHGNEGPPVAQGGAEAAEEESPFEEEIESFRESSWLAEEPERGEAERSREPWPGVESHPRADEAPTAEISPAAYDLRPTEPLPGGKAAPSGAKPIEEITADEAEVLFDVPPSSLEGEEEEDAEPLEAEPEPVPAAASPEPAAAAPLPAPEPVSAPPPQELEALAQTSSIPELAQMLSSVSRGGEALSEADIDRLAARIVEKLSDRVIREIAWEVIPDMAEIVIKQRIKEIEAGLE